MENPRGALIKATDILEQACDNMKDHDFSLEFLSSLDAPIETDLESLSGDDD